MDAIADKFKLEIGQICQEEGISKLMLFGSQARGEAGSDSDVDLMVEFKEVPGLIGFVGVKQRFESLFGKEVDLVTERGLSKYLAPYITHDLKVIYEQ